MAVPFGAIAGSFVVMCSSSNRHRNSSNNSFNLKEFEKNRILLTRRNLVHSYIEENYKTNAIIEEENFELDTTIYILKFDDITIITQISNEYLINSGTRDLHNYIHHLVYKELNKAFKNKYFKENKKEHDNLVTTVDMLRGDE